MKLVVAILGIALIAGCAIRKPDGSFVACGSVTTVKTPEGMEVLHVGLFDSSLDGLKYSSGPTSRPTTIEINKYESKEKASGILGGVVNIFGDLFKVLFG